MQAHFLARYTCSLECYGLRAFVVLTQDLSVSTCVQDGRQLQHYLANTQAALKQADVRIAILEERNITLQQVGMWSLPLYVIHLLCQAYGSL